MVNNTFNLSFVASTPLPQFLADNAAMWPEKTEEERTADLTAIHGQAVGELAAGAFAPVVFAS